MKVLYLYSCGEYPVRPNIWSFLFCFRRYSRHFVFYHNVSVQPLPFWLRWVHFDLVIFSHSMTAPWNPSRFSWRLEKFKRTNFRSTRRIAFFQDEFFQSDLRTRFVNELGIDAVYSVAPPSEWKTIYQGVNNGVRFEHYLTGYVDADLREEFKEKPRPIDIGYRTWWASGEMFRLGSFGTLKFKIGQRVREQHGDLRVDIKMGEGLLRGKAWLEFLRQCRYTLGVESGASMLDRDGRIGAQIQAQLTQNPAMTFDEVREICFKEHDGNLNLKAISPRIFEAAAARTGMILVEGEFSGLLKPYTHYLPLAEDFSNLDEILEKSKDEEMRRKLVENAYRDLIEKENCTFKTFVDQFFEREQQRLSLSPMRLHERGVYFLSLLNDFASWTALAILTMLRRLRRACGPKK